MDKVSELKNKQSYCFEDLVEIIKILRSENGCPWDREQDHKSIRNSFIEETYEFIEGVDNDDYTLMCEELGDVLLQIVFHSQIADESDKFNISNVIDGICKKMILRHPHIFSETVVNSSQEVLENWDKIKKKEKNQKTVSEKMEQTSKALPALIRAMKLGKCAAKVGFDFEDAEQALIKVEEEIKELREEMKNGTYESKCEEMGDLLFSVVNTSRLMDINPEEALYNANEKFCKRFQRLEQYAMSKGDNLAQISMSEMDKIWDIIKR